MSGGNVDLDAFGRAAYEAWWALRKPDDYEIAAWRELDPAIREAWRAAADAVREAAQLRHVEHRRLKFTRDTAVTAIEVEPIGPKGVVPTLHVKTGDVLVCSPDGGEVYVQRDGGHVVRYVDDGRGVLRPVTP